MIFYLGALWTPPVVLAINLLLVVLVASAAVAVLQAVFGVDLPGGASVPLIGAVLLIAGGYGGAARLGRRLGRRRAIALGDLDEGDARAVGPKARVLAALRARGLPVAPGLVVLVKPGTPLARLARRVVRFAADEGIARLVVRSAFAEEDGEGGCPGRFESALGVDARDPSAVEEALARVVASRTGERAASLGGVSPDDGLGQRPAAVLVQAQVEHRARGVLSSFDPRTRRLDHVYVELTDPEGRELGAARFDLIFGRWLERTAALSDAQAGALLEACRAAEGVLRGPVAIEFGLIEDRVVVYQARPMPEVELAEVWTNTGPVELNAEPSPPLLADLAYGEGLELLAERLGAGAAIEAGPRADAARPRLRQIEGRPYVAYRSVAEANRFRPRPRASLGQLAAFLRADAGLVRAEPPAVVGDDFEAARAALRSMLRGQSLGQAHAQVWEGWREALAGWAATAERPPIPWPGAAVAWIERRVAALGARRAELRARVLAQLGALEALAEALLPAGHEVRRAGLVRFLSARELRALVEAGPGAPTLADLEARRRDLDAWASRPAEPVIGEAVEGPGEGPAVGDTGEVLRLRPLVGGAREGRGRLARPDLAFDEPLILVVPDQSLRWQPLAGRAAAVVMVGGGVLSHLGLQLLHSRTPTLFGLTPGEARRLDGAWLRLDGTAGRLEIVAAGAAARRSPP